MILYAFKKLPHKRINLGGRMYMVRRSDKHARLYLRMRKEKIRWK